MTDFSYQLYSSRNFPPLDDTLKMIASHGYTGVEGFGALFGAVSDLGAFRARLDELNLKMRSSHLGLLALRNDTANTLAIAKTMGMSQVFGPHITPEEGRPTGAAGWVEFGKMLHEMGKPITDAGFVFGWHNHDFEFEAVEGDEIPMHLVLDNAPELTLEFDVAWAVRANFDPLKTIEKYGSRIAAAHVKDIAPAGECEDEDGWADVGHGIVDWPTIFAALKQAGTSNFVTEHDNPNDHERFARRSIEAAKAL